MSVNAVHANTPVNAPEAAASSQPKVSPTKNQPTTPQDTVTLSTAAKTPQPRPSVDVDRDGDSK
jgi:hypothetical protein